MTNVLKSLFATRWACCSEAVSEVYQQSDAIIAAIEESINDTSDSKARAKGKGILYQIKSCDFIIALEMMNPILQLIVPVSKTFHSQRIDLCQAIEEVDNLALALEKLRIEEKEFDNMYSRAAIDSKFRFVK